MALSQEIKIEAACQLGARCAEVSIPYDYRLGEPKLRVWRDGIGNLVHLFQKRLRMAGREFGIQGNTTRNQQNKTEIV